MGAWRRIIRLLPRKRAVLSACAVVGICGGAMAAQTSKPAVDPAADLVSQGQEKQRDGKPDEALALYRQALQASPRSFAANNQAGILLDLTGEYGEARKLFSTAMQVASSGQQKAQAERAMAISYAFERNCTEAAKYQVPLHEMYLAEKDFYNAGEIANELARICLEANKLDEALKWYRVGWEAGLREPNIQPDRRDLWNFRWEHAQARVAARRGDKADAQKHVDAAKAILDKGTNSGQGPFFPYLVGYVAFHTGDYKTAVAELQKANQNDPFILVLLAQSHEKLGDQATATEYYRKVLTAPTAHNPPNAFARPLAKKKLG